MLLLTERSLKRRKDCHFCNYGQSDIFKFTCCRIPLFLVSVYVHVQEKNENVFLNSFTTVWDGKGILAQR